MHDGLIDRQALIAEIMRRGIYPPGVRHAIENAPAIDAVPVVRCKDCRKFAPYSDRFKNEYPDSKDGACMMLLMCVYEWQDAGRYNDDFCSYGERKEIGND